jgi:N-acetylmuramoyl-L-alanine amidase
MLRLVYPQTGHRTDESSTFLLGQASSRLFIDHDEIPRSASGFFSHPLPLSVGENEFQLTSAETQLTLRVFRDEPTAERLFSTYAFPQKHHAYLETVTLSCPAPTGSRVTAKVQGLSVELLPGVQPLETRVGVFAQLHHLHPPLPETWIIYQASVMTVEGHVTYTIESPDQSLPAEFTTEGSLEKWSHPRWAEVKESALMRSFPAEHGARLSPPLSKSQVKVVGIENDYAIVSLSQSRHAAIPLTHITWQKTASLLVQALMLIRVEADSLKTIYLTMPFKTPPLYDFVLSEKGVRLTLYHVSHACDFIHYAPSVFEETALHKIECRVIEDTTLRIDIEMPCYGAALLFDSEQLVLSIKSQASYEKTPHILIDPGHGGEELGAIAPNGVPEKTLNFIQSLALKMALEAQGFRVSLTRESDVTVSLAQRVAMAEKADLMLSLHHNALPDGRDPQLERGVSTYYYHAMSLPWAKQLQTALSKEVLLPSYGILFDSLAICRNTLCPSLLLELGFLTHPEDCERLLQDETPPWTNVASQLSKLFR